MLCTQNAWWPKTLLLRSKLHATLQGGRGGGMGAQERLEDIAAYIAKETGT
jgi:hypothetical protein